jgi:hypothetical protein
MGQVDGETELLENARESSEVVVFEENMQVG